MAELADTQSIIVFVSNYFSIYIPVFILNAFKIVKS